MAGKTDFRRKQKKYLLSQDQYLRMRRRLLTYMKTDRYGLHTIKSIYFDTSDFYLIRNSLERPIFKQKFRLRHYPGDGIPDKLYAQIKRKYKGIVYKRRIDCKKEEFEDLLCGKTLADRDVQIQKEIRLLFSTYPLSPSAQIVYDREALFCPDDPLLRVTFDSSLRGSSIDRIDFSLPAQDRILNAHPGKEYIMEIKFPGTSPLWLCRILSEEEIYPQSFSKYGTWYLHSLLPSRAK